MVALKGVSLVHGCLEMLLLLLLLLMVVLGIRRKRRMKGTPVISREMFNIMARVLH